MIQVSTDSNKTMNHLSALFLFYRDTKKALVTQFFTHYICTLVLVDFLGNICFSYDQAYNQGAAEPNQIFTCSIDGVGQSFSEKNECCFLRQIN